MPEAGIFLVADGVGGHNSGEVASRTTMTDIAGFIRENPIPDSEGDDILIDYFLSLITEVNTHVREMAQDTAPRGMATTLLMLYIKADTAYVINIGDSRAYLIRDGEILRSRKIIPLFTIWSRKALSRKCRLRRTRTEI